MGIIIAHSSIYYFVLILWPPILTFSILSIDILYNFRNSLVGRVSMKHAVLSIPKIDIFCELRTYWSHGWTICRVYGHARGSLCELSLRVLSASSL